MQTLVCDGAQWVFFWLVFCPVVFRLEWVPPGRPGGGVVEIHPWSCQLLLLPIVCAIDGKVGIPLMVLTNITTRNYKL